MTVSRLYLLGCIDCAMGHRAKLTKATGVNSSSCLQSGRASRTDARLVELVLSLTSDRTRGRESLGIVGPRKVRACECCSAISSTSIHDIQ